jgi:hypothetical protein
VRECRQCGETKPLADYYKNARCAAGHVRVCKACYALNTKERMKDPERLARKRERNREWKKNNPDRVRDHHRRGDLWKCHRLRWEDYERLLEAQGGACRICGTDDPGEGRRFAVDHDHNCCPSKDRSCGKCVRGLLCNRCNLMIGMAEDDPSLLREAALYLTVPGI